MPSSKLFRRILVPHDFSDAAARALKEAVALAATHEGRLIVQHVIVPFYMPTELPFGLAGYAFTKSIKNAHLLAQRVEVGMLWINQPATP